MNDSQYTRRGWRSPQNVCGLVNSILAVNIAAIWSPFSVLRIGTNDNVHDLCFRVSIVYKNEYVEPGLENVVLLIEQGDILRTFPTKSTIRNPSNKRRQKPISRPT